ncbi:MAG: DUF5063 domain-containing protein [Bacteroidales bacterium]|nr:DUF5063 domain-containing protein [Bacteroidales bacterium]
MRLTRDTLMPDKKDPVFSRSVVEFTAAANEFCKYAEHASEINGNELLRIFQRILPFLYIKASLLPSLDPFFEDGNENFVTESDWFRIHDTLREKFGSADDFPEISDEPLSTSDVVVLSSLSENIADIYQDLKDYLLLYQTGTREVMNDAVWECRQSFEDYWGNRLVNSLKAIHRFIYCGEEIEKIDTGGIEGSDRDTSSWFMTRRQKEWGGNGE